MSWLLRSGWSSGEEVSLAAFDSSSSGSTSRGEEVDE
jgi:hypothetical protein